ncbi:Elongation of very long chain fatty acids protein 4 [Fragariocoptes setiger]|uniref:Elongation of very long chain fatty acids protein n=1 Tax=Fragariocoptes setiger TaxID=1670756 RepID=A0ABQ7S794_9ACAR|nr:Elongation of very long chain fatty acids protein 4 [Fragariocoptes setiger]
MDAQMIDQVGTAIKSAAHDLISNSSSQSPPLAATAASGTAALQCPDIVKSCTANDDSLCAWVRYIFTDVWEELGDPETNNYFWLRGGPWLTWLATIAYLVIVLKLGPAFMRSRPPYDLKVLIRFYNLLLVVINFYLLQGTLRTFRYGLDFWGCTAALSLEKRTPLLQYGHLFFHTRYLEFFDTFFFVLRKKQSQITFLHVFHHGVVPTLMYIGLKFYPMPINALLPSTNMFVHIIMYAYYGLATFGPGIQKYLWWKRYLTRMQISQFALLLIHCAQPLYLPASCHFPAGLIVINSCIGLVFLMLFSSFYLTTYCQPGKTILKSDDSPCASPKFRANGEQSSAPAVHSLSKGRKNE